MIIIAPEKNLPTNVQEWVTIPYSVMPELSAITVKCPDVNYESFNIVEKIENKAYFRVLVDELLFIYPADYDIDSPPSKPFLQSIH